MANLLHMIAVHVAYALEAMAIIVIAIGSAQAFAYALTHMADRRDTAQGRAVWLQFCRWLVAGMTFQIAADAVHTTIAPTWSEIGRLAAIAGVRTFLSFFLERDMEKHGTGELGA
jgi:uncharacterized membrane protein